jgi:hypothetical protein
VELAKTLLDRNYCGYIGYMGRSIFHGHYDSDFLKEVTPFFRILQKEPQNRTALHYIYYFGKSWFFHMFGLFGFQRLVPHKYVFDSMKLFWSVGCNVQKSVFCFIHGARKTLKIPKDVVTLIAKDVWDSRSQLDQYNWKFSFDPIQTGEK